MPPHPIPYQGSKRRLADAILSHFPSRVDRLVEPFAGSAAVSIAAASHGCAARFWINDANAPLAALWQAIIDTPEDISADYAALWESQLGKERSYYDAVRTEFNRDGRPEHLLYLLARCVKAAVRYNAQGEFNNSPDNRRRGMKPDKLRKEIRGAARLLSGRTLVTARDYRDVLAKCDASDLIYLDPPYQGVGGSKDSRYGAKIDPARFHESLAALNRKGCSYLVSYDGRTGDKRYGEPLPAELELTHLELPAGRSSQATLLGRTTSTFESLYLSPSLVTSLGNDE